MPVGNFDYQSLQIDFDWALAFGQHHADVIPGARGLELGQDSHPLHDLDRGAPQVDWMAAHAQRRRPLNHSGTEPVMGEPVREDRTGDAGARDQDVWFPGRYE